MAYGPQGTTFQLSLTLGGNAKNVYTIYGEEGSPIQMPPSYQARRPSRLAFSVDGCRHPIRKPPIRRPRCGL
jgi:hypothetical protein